MKATAVAPANIAFIKYWGKSDEKLRLPLNPSISMNLSVCVTTTTVEFSERFTHDTVSEGFDSERIIRHIDYLRKLAQVELRVHISTKNSFPAAAGIASSASGFAALTVAASSALGLHMSEKRLSKLARTGSGSACRSIPDGFVEWKDEYAYSLYPHDYWDLRDILVIVDSHMKKVSTTEGMKAVRTSPLLPARLAALPGRIARIKKALTEKNFQEFGEIMEEECLDMHRVMQTQTPPLYYWTGDTVDIMELIKQRTIPAYFTIDAGPNVHIICEAKNEVKLIELLKDRKIIINKPARGARII